MRKAGFVMLAVMALAPGVVVAQTDSLNCRLVGICDGAGFAHGVAKSDSIVYVADAWVGLRTINVVNPELPFWVGYCELAWAFRVAVAGCYAYVASGDAGLCVVDVENPKEPRVVGLCDTPGSALDVALADSHTLVADYTGGLCIVNVANPESPFVVGRCSTAGATRAVAVRDSFAYLAVSGYGMRVVNVADPSNPRIVGKYDPWMYACDVAAGEGLAFVATERHGLRIVDVRDPQSPREIGSCPTPSNAVAAAVVGNLVYFAGLRVVDVADPRNPREVGFYDTPGGSYDLCVEGRMVYIADDDAMRIVEYYGAGVEEAAKGELRAANAGATLVRGSLVLSRELSADSRQPVVLLDAAGRRVMRLQAGENDVRHLSPGVYFVHLPPDIRHSTPATKVVLTK